MLFRLKRPSPPNSLRVLYLFFSYIMSPYVLAQGTIWTIINPNEYYTHQLNWVVLIRLINSFVVLACLPSVSVCAVPLVPPFPKYYITPLLGNKMHCMLSVFGVQTGSRSAGGRGALSALAGQPRDHECNGLHELRNDSGELGLTGLGYHLPAVPFFCQI